MYTSVRRAALDYNGIWIMSSHSKLSSLYIDIPQWEKTFIPFIQYRSSMSENPLRFLTNSLKYLWLVFYKVLHNVYFLMDYRAGAKWDGKYMESSLKSTNGRLN